MPIPDDVDGNSNSSCGVCQRSSGSEYDLNLLQNLIDENQDLKKRCNELEKETESLQSLLDCLQKHKRNELGDEEKLETILVCEATSRENQLRQQLSRLEADLRAEKSESKALRQEMDRLVSEQERLEEMNHSAIDQLKKTRSELKDLKVRDLRLEEENGSLEEENVSLQSSLSKLKSTMISYESLQHENDCLRDQLAELKYQVDEVTSLKSISEKQVEELFENLKEERQLKYQLKKELANHIQQASLTRLSDLVGGIGRYCSNNSDAASEMDEQDASDRTATTDSDCAMQNNQHPSLAAEGLLNASEAVSMQREFVEKIVGHNVRLEKILSQLGCVEVSDECCPFMSSSDPIAKQDQALSRLEGAIRCGSRESGEIDMMRNELSECKASLQMFEESLSRPVKLLIGVIDDLNQLRPGTDCECNIDGPDTDLIYVLNSVAGRIALQVRQFCDFYQTNSAGERRSQSSSDESDCADTVHKLKSLLADKRAKIATLRLIVETDRQTAEHAIANLKTKFENDKLAVTETMRNLRNELKVMKESAAMFAKFRALFTARCDEYVAQIEALQKKLQVCEDENNMLNSLLRMAIKQKVNLSEKLERIPSIRIGNRERILQKQIKFIPPRNASKSEDDACNEDSMRA